MTTFRTLSTVALAGALLAGALPASAQNGLTRTRRVGEPPAAEQKPAKPASKPGGTPAQVNKTPIDEGDRIQLSTDVVNVLFSATDDKNRFVPDIKEGDVVVTEGGVPQTVFSFSQQTNLPLSVAIMVDVSSSQEATFADEKRAAAGFLQNVLRPRKDSAAIVSFREEVNYVQGMTNRLERVNEAFNRLNWESRIAANSRYGATALYDAIGITAAELFPKDPANENAETITRRAIIVLTDGDDNASDRSLQDAIDDALKSDVIVYVVGVGERYRPRAVKRDVLELLAKQTGGRAYFPESYDDLKTAFEQINQELRSQYLLAYEPTNTARDGKFRPIEITVPGRGDVKIFHRKGYYAPRDAGTGPAPGASNTTP